MSLLPVVNFHENGEEGHKKDRGCRYMVASCALQRWGSGLCDSWAEFRVRLRPCAPKVRLWVKQRIQLSLLTCGSSSLCAFFLDCKTQWRLFCWEKLLTSPTRPWCTQVWIDPAGYCFRLRMSFWILHSQCFSIGTQKPDSLSLNISSYGKNH